MTHPVEIATVFCKEHIDKGQVAKTRLADSVDPLLHKVVGAGVEDEERVVLAPATVLVQVALDVAAAIALDENILNLVLEGRHLVVDALASIDDRVLLCKAVRLDKCLVECRRQVAKVIGPIIGRATGPVGVAERIEVVGLDTAGPESRVGM